MLKIRDLKTLTRLRYSEIERKIGYPAKYLSNRVNVPMNKLRGDDLLKISKFLNISIEELLTLDLDNVDISFKASKK